MPGHTGYTLCFFLLRKFLLALLFFRLLLKAFLVKLCFLISVGSRLLLGRSLFCSFSFSFLMLPRAGEMPRKEASSIQAPEQLPRPTPSNSFRTGKPCLHRGRGPCCVVSQSSLSLPDLGEHRVRPCPLSSDRGACTGVHLFMHSCLTLTLKGRAYPWCHRQNPPPVALRTWQSPAG